MFWANGLGAELAVKRGIGTIVLNVRRVRPHTKARDHIGRARSGAIAARSEQRAASMRPVPGRSKRLRPSRESVSLGSNIRRCRLRLSAPAWDRDRDLQDRLHPRSPTTLQSDSDQEVVLVPDPTRILSRLEGRCKAGSRLRPEPAELVLPSPVRRRRTQAPVRSDRRPTEALRRRCWRVSFGTHCGWGMVWAGHIRLSTRLHKTCTFTRQIRFGRHTWDKR
jgi:hypothetical protein